MDAECDCDSLQYPITDAACDDTGVYVFCVEDAHAGEGRARRSI